MSELSDIENAWTFGSTCMFILNSFMTVTPTLAYFAQVRKIKRLDSSLGFSKKISLLLLLSSILRIFFWFGKKFHWSLLGQAIFMTIMQVYMVKVCLHYDPTNVKNREKSFKSIFILENFWKWGYLRYYVLFLSVFTLIFFILFAIFTFKNEIFVDFIGYLSAGIEAFLVLPQVITNYKLQSTKSLSFIVLSNWIFGDITKTMYFYVTQAPIQLKLCGFTQIFIDFVVVGQIFYYRSNKDHNNDSEDSMNKDIIEASKVNLKEENEVGLILNKSHMDNLSINSRDSEGVSTNPSSLSSSVRESLSSSVRASLNLSAKNNENNENNEKSVELVTIYN